MHSNQISSAILAAVIVFFAALAVAAGPIGAHSILIAVSALGLIGLGFGNGIGGRRHPAAEKPPVSRAYMGTPA